MSSPLDKIAPRKTAAPAVTTPHDTAKTLAALDKIAPRKTAAPAVTTPQHAGGIPGMVEPPSMNFYAEPEVERDGTTVNRLASAPYQIDGVTVLLPVATVHGRELRTDAQRLQEYRLTGRHLGKFTTREAAEAQALQLRKLYSARGFARSAGADAIKAAKNPNTPEQRWKDQAFSDAGPATQRPGIARTLVEEAKGLGKAVIGDLSLGVLDTGVMLGKFGALTQGTRPIDTTAFDQSVGLDKVRDFLESKNPEQTAGKVTEFIAAFLLPYLKMGKGAEAANVVKAVDATAPRLVKPVDPAAPRLVKPVDPIIEMLNEVRAAKPTPNMPNSVELPPQVTVTRGGQPARSAIEIDLENTRPESAVGRSRTAAEIADTEPFLRGRTYYPYAETPAPSMGAYSTATPVRSAAADAAYRVEPRTVQVTTKAEKAPVIEQAVQELAQATPAPPPTASPVEQLTVMMQGKEAVLDRVINSVATQAGPETAAEAIEAHITRMFKDAFAEARRKMGAQRAGDFLFGNSKRGGLIEGLPKGLVERGVRKQVVESMAPDVGSHIPEIVPEPARTALEAERAAKAAAREGLKNASGAVDMYTGLGLGGAVAGGALGSTVGNDTEDRVINSILGGFVGALLVPALAHATASRSVKPLQNYMYTSVLSSPQSAVKAWMGATSGTIEAAVEQMAAGNARAGQRILTTLFSPQSVRTFLGALKNPATAQMSGVAAGQAPNIVGRIFGAGDAVARRAMAAGGIGAEAAARYTLAGAPTTALGKTVLNAYSKSFTLRLLSTMFPRVGIQILERGAERLPLGVKVARAINPAAGSARAILSKQVMGAAAGLGAYEFNDQTPLWAKPYLMAMSGVYALPVSMGMAAAEGQKRRGSLSLDSLDDIANTIAQQMPFPQYGPWETIKQHLTGSSLVPAIVRDIARAQDPYERETTRKAAGIFGRTKAKIPGLRETLPVKPGPVNIAGQPNQDRSNAFVRVMSAAPSRNLPMQDIPAPVVAELKRLDVQVNVPSLRPEGKVGKTNLKDLPIDPDVLEAARVERRALLIPAIEKLLASDAYQRADDATKKRRLAATVERAQQAGAARSRAKLIKLLRSQGVLKR